MKKVFEYADKYIAQSDWKVLAALKFCLAAIGVLIGISLPARHRRPAAVIAGSVFLATYIPLMAKFVRIVVQDQEAEGV